MADSQRTKVVALGAAGIVCALLGGAAVGWLARGSEVSDLKDEVATLERAAEADEPSEITTWTVESDDDGIATGDAADTAAAASGAAQPPAAAGGVTERQPGEIVEVIGSPGAYVLRIDYVQFLGGAEAIAAATAHGDESPPPNDYYIVNDNPRIRDFPIADGISVLVVTTDDGLSDSGGHAITLDQWVAALRGPYGSAFKSGIYWVTVTDGVVTAIEAQYLP